MRNVKLQVQMTIDGYIAGPTGEMDWLTFNWDQALKNYVDALTQSVDCLILGRKLAQGFIPHWAAVAADADNPEVKAGQKFIDIHKVVFTRTLHESVWHNTVLATGDLVDELTNLKRQEGNDIMVYGGATFVSSLLKHGLVDELHLFVNPTAIGRGMPIFQELNSPQKMTMAKATPFDCGIVVLQYNLNRK